MKLNILPSNISLSIALFLSASLYTFDLKAQESEELQEIPSDRGVASPTQADDLAMQGLRVEEGLGESEPQGITEAQKTYIDKKAEEDEEIRKEEADAELDQAEAAEISATTQPYTASPIIPATVINRPVVTPIVDGENVEDDDAAASEEAEEAEEAEE